MKKFLLPSLLAVVAFAAPARAADAPKPLKVLLITGGCCHDYARQKDLLKAGIEKRANVIVEHAHSPDNGEQPPLSIYGNPQYAKGYDVIIHDECAAKVSDQAVIEGVLAPHLDGTPGVNLHCAMHCYRIGNPREKATAGTPRSLWFDYLGLQSSGHGPQEPIALVRTDSKHPITSALQDWTTVKEELYNNIQIFPGSTVLMKGTQVFKQKDGSEKKDETVVTWTNLYGPKKTRVFSTTIGHNNETVGDDRYLDLVTCGLLWACDKIEPTGKPKPGYEAKPR